MHPSPAALVAFLVFPYFSAISAEKIYTPPDLQGASSPAVAQPRDDWYATVQQKFDRYSGKPAAIIFDGDSITNRWEIAGKKQWSQFFAARAADFGIEGDRVENVLWRLSKGQVDGMNPKVVVIMIGTNNAKNSPEEIAEGIKALVSEYRKRCPQAHIILMGVFPRGAKPTDPLRSRNAAVNKIIKSLDDGKNVTFVDITPKLIQPDGTISKAMMPDFLHPTAAGYEIWTAAIQPIIKKYAP